MRLIDVDAMLTALCKNCGTSGRCIIPCVDYDMIVQFPTIDAEPVRHGRWIAQDNTYTRYMCSECESKNHGGHEKYCPNCGAKMDGENDEA